MEPKKLKEIEERVRKMPHGPLVPCTCGHCGAAWNVASDVAVVYFTDSHDAEQPIPQNITDAYRDFFIHAVDDVPLLLATIRSLQGDLARIQHQVKMKEMPDLMQQAIAKLDIGKHGEERHERKEKEKETKKAAA